MRDERQGNRSAAVRRAGHAVLDHVAAAGGPVRARDVAAALGLTLPTTYHLLTTLVTAGYLVHPPQERAYALGHRVDDLARALHRQIAAPPEVRRVAAVVHREAHAVPEPAGAHHHAGGSRMQQRHRLADRVVGGQPGVGPLVASL